MEKNRYNTSNDAVTIIITTVDNKILLQIRDNKPQIEFPGYFGLLSGYIEEGETPIEAVIREIKEELSHKTNSQIRLSKITYLGSVYRDEFNRNDYIHHAYLLDDPSKVEINEGKGVLYVDYNECLKLDNLAPHHKLNLFRYWDRISKINYDVESMGSFDKVSINELVEVYKLNEGKDLEKLEHGIGFFEGEGEDFTSLIHPGEDIKFIAYLKFIPNSPRGNHYHLRKVEYMLLLNGEMMAELRLQSNEDVHLEVKWNKGEIIRFLPGVIHTLTAIGESTVSAIEFAPQQFANSDVYKMKKG